MMARSTKGSNQRPDTLMQDRTSPNSETSSCNARPDHTFGSTAAETIGEIQRPMSALPPKADKRAAVSLSPLCADCVAKVFLAFGRETLIQDRTRTRNNDSKEPTLRFDCYKFLFHRACLATFATQSALSGHGESSASLSAFGRRR